MNSEIERKYLVFNLPDLSNLESKTYKQGYTFSFHHDQVRLRKSINSKELTQLTIKRGDGEKRREFEIPLTEFQFEKLWPATEGKRVQKTRYFYPLDSHEAEVDVYDGCLDALRTVEVEFDTCLDAKDFHPPGWFGPDVTEEPEFKNKQLALNGIPKAFEDYKKLYDNTLT